MLAMKGHEYSLKKLLNNFLNATEKMVQTSVFGEGVKIIGHVDKVVLNAQQLPEFEQLSDWFYDALLRILIEHRHKYDYVEINTRALYKKGFSQPYPRFALLDELHQHQIPLLLNSDAHHPSEIAGGYKECQDKLTSLTNINPHSLQFQWPKK
jgi:histidinol-phosphatase (PHP family)